MVNDTSSSSDVGSTRLRLGARGEKIALATLLSKRFDVLLTNYRNKAGEIDIIALDGAEICFIEVKTRHQSTGAKPAEGLRSAQQARISRAAGGYLSKIGSPALPHRFDLIEVVVNDFDVVSVRHWPGHFK